MVMAIDRHCYHYPITFSNNCTERMEEKKKATEIVSSTFDGFYQISYQILRKTSALFSLKNFALKSMFYRLFSFRFEAGEC